MAKRQLHETDQSGQRIINLAPPKTPTDALPPSTWATLTGAGEARLWVEDAPMTGPVTKSGQFAWVGWPGVFTTETGGAGHADTATAIRANLVTGITNPLSAVAYSFSVEIPNAAKSDSVFATGGARFLGLTWPCYIRPFIFSHAPTGRISIGMQTSHTADFASISYADYSTFAYPTSWFQMGTLCTSLALVVTHTGGGVDIVP